MSLSSLPAKIGASVAMMFVVLATLLATSSPATADGDCGQLPPGWYCVDGHPWHN